MNITSKINNISEDEGKGISDYSIPDRKEDIYSQRLYWCIRRSQDLLLSVFALLMLWPLMLVTMAAIWIDDPHGSPIYSQVRVGRNGKKFIMYKFRSMYMDADVKLNEVLKDNEMDGPVFKMHNDPRITRVGRLIRKVCIDELPQLINILRGDMSIVGPRPPLPREVVEYTPLQMQRLYVTPGLTCYWQIQPRRNDLSFDEWVELDLKYIQERSFWVDWKIILKTFGAVFSGEGI